MLSRKINVCAMLVYTVAFPFRQDQVCDNCTGPPSHPSIDEAYEASMRSNTTWVASCQEDGNLYPFLLSFMFDDAI